MCPKIPLLQAILLAGFTVIFRPRRPKPMPTSTKPD